MWKQRPDDRAFNIAEVNIAVLKAPIDSPLLADFVAWLDLVNAIADGSPGFVWRLQTEDGDATAIRAFGDDRIIVNMSVWESIEALANYVYRSGHVEVMRRRREWFERTVEAYQCLWWVPVGHTPMVTEAEERLAHLRLHGPNPHAFTFRTRFASLTATPVERLDAELWNCPA